MSLEAEENFLFKFECFNPFYIMPWPHKYKKPIRKTNFKISVNQRQKCLDQLKIEINEKA